jgi:hypothetical protein
MTHSVTPARIDGRTLLAWCGYAALAGLFVAIGIGSALIVR